MDVFARPPELLDEALVDPSAEAAREGEVRVAMVSNLPRITAEPGQGHTCRLQVSTTTGTIIGLRRSRRLTQVPMVRRTICWS